MFRLRSALQASSQVCSTDTSRNDIQAIMENKIQIPQSRDDFYFIPSESTPEFLTTSAGGASHLEFLVHNSKDSSHNKNLQVVRAYPKKEKEGPKSCAWGVIREQRITPEIHRELKALQLRGAANPKKFFKRTYTKSLPTRFHIGYPVPMSNIKSIGESTEFFNHSKSRKHRSLVSELLRDNDVVAFTKRKALAARIAGNSGNKRSYKKRVMKRVQKR